MTGFHISRVQVISKWSCQLSSLDSCTASYYSKGDLLLTCKGTIGEIAYNNFGKAHIARQIMAIRNNYSLNVDFLALCIEYSMTKIKQAAKGLIPGISREDILNLLIPIPPTKEQEKICDKLKVTFSAIKHIEKAS